MAKKVLVGLLLVMVLLLSACYPELSVQQYDKLREDLEELDVQRQGLETEVAGLEAEVASLQTENDTIKAHKAVTLAYVEFLFKLVSTQSSAKLLAGEFDAEALITAKDELIEAAASLNDEEIVYFLGLMSSDDESLTAGAYYKVVEYCVKNMKQNLE